MAGEDVGEKSDGEADQTGDVGDRLDHEDEALEGGVHVLEAWGQPAGEVLEEALGADPFEVVADPDDEREDQRDREVRGRRVEGEGGDRDAEDVDRVLGVHRQRDEADHVREPDPEEERGEEGEPAGGHLGVEVAAGDRVLGHVVGDLDRDLDPVGFLLHPLRDPEHRRDRQAAGQQQVGDRFVDAEVDAAELDRDPRFELELVLRLVALVFPCVAEDQEHQDREAEIGADSDQDLGLGAEPALGAARGSGLLIHRVGRGRRRRCVCHYAPCPSGSPPNR